MSKYYLEESISRKTKVFLILLALYVTFSILADAFAYRYINVGFGIFLSGATIFFPCTYPISDLTCELFGFKSTFWFLFILGLVMELIFAAGTLAASHLPFVSTFQHTAFKAVFGKTWLFVSGGIISNLITGYLNLALMSRWKVKMRGAWFWLRSVLITIAMEFLTIFILFTIAFSSSSAKIPDNLYVFMFNTVIFDLIVIWILSGVAALAKPILIKYSGANTYDTNSYNPFK